MRIETKKVKDREYLQYVDPYGHIFHIGPADNLENWKIAFWLYGNGLFEMKGNLENTLGMDVQKRFNLDEEGIIALQSCLGDGMSSVTGDLTKKLNKIFDKKATEFDELRNLIKRELPQVKTKKQIRETVCYNWRLRHPKQKIETAMEITAS
jgi:hypothetical protein